MLAKQGGLKPVFDQPLARPGDRVDTGLQRRRDLAIAPARTTLRGVSFQQDAGLQQLVRRSFPLWIRVVSCSRSSSLRVTMYFFTAISFLAMNPLRRW
jgi:hypothetical protein